jgi:hypothetical protein
MTPDERTLLTQFLADLRQARAGARDAEAASLIADTFAANPDAAYLLTQHTILSDQALHAAQGRIADLEAQLRSAPAPAGSSFLGGAWQGGQQTSVPQTAPSGFSPFSAGGGLGSFLRNAGTMAAGIAGGDLLFEGLSGLFGGHRGFGFGGGYGGGGYGAPVENVTVNNYNDDGGQYDNSGWDGGSGDYGSQDN